MKRKYSEGTQYVGTINRRIFVPEESAPAMWVQVVGAIAAAVGGWLFLLLMMSI